MNVPDDAVEAAAEAWVSRHAQPGSWTLEQNLRAALEAAAPYFIQSAYEMGWEDGREGNRSHMPPEVVLSVPEHLRGEDNATTVRAMLARLERKIK